MPTAPVLSGVPLGPDQSAVADEGARLLAFLIPGGGDVELREIEEEAQRA